MIPQNSIRSSILENDDQCGNIPSNFLSITDGSNYTKRNIYSCRQLFKEYLSITSGLLHLYHCQFTYFLESAVQVYPDGCSSDGSIEIAGCQFLRCEKGSIIIKSKPSSRTIKISDCTFTLCQCYKGGSAITFNTANGLIEKCHFLNSYGLDNADIYYDYEIPEDPTNNYRLTIKDCTFDRKYALQKGGPFIKFTKSCKFDLINNNFSFHQSIYLFHLFDWPSDLNDINGLTFEGNIMYPYLETVLSNTNGLPLEIFKRRTVNCQSIGAPSNTVLCSTDSYNSEGPISTQFTIKIDHCIFYALTNTDSKLGGAVYISTGEVMSSDITSPITVCYSDFCACKCTNGGAICFESSEKVRFFDVRNCFFSSNMYGKYNEKAVSKGGAILILSDAASFRIIDCVFESNKCGEGAAICFISNSTHPISMHSKSDDFEYSLNVIDCKFSHNEGFTNGGAIFISVSNEYLDKPIEINGCEFVDNRADEKDYLDADLPENGGSIYYSRSSSKGSFRIYECNFVVNVVSYFGGAIFIDSHFGELVEIIDSNFDRNSAKFDVFSSIRQTGYGGDIYYQSNSQSVESSFSYEEIDIKPSLTVSNCTFLSSFAKFDGGSILISIQDGDPSGSIDIKNCLFESNRASNGNGGSIYFSGLNGRPLKGIELIQCSFNNCSSQKGGGAIYINFSKDVLNPVLIESLHVTNCDAAFGGAVYVFSDKEETEIKICSCSFVRNKANISSSSGEKTRFVGGSALFIHAMNITVDDCNFLNNKNNQITVYNNFDDLPSSRLFELEKSDTSISIRNSFFDMTELSSSGCSLLYVTGDKREVHSEVKNCVFKGEPLHGMHHIDRASLSEKSGINNKLHIESCKFELNSKSGMNSMYEYSLVFTKYGKVILFCFVCAISVSIIIVQKTRRSVKIMNDNDERTQI